MTKLSLYAMIMMLGLLMVGCNQGLQSDTSLGLSGSEMTVSGDTTIMHDGDHSSPEAVDGGEEIQGQRDTAVIDDILIQVDTGVSNDTDVEVIPLNRTAMRVFMADMAFNPGEITISAGTQITWTNNDDMPHDVVATDGSFKSPILQKGETFTYIFHDKGSFSYYCSLHPNMKGKVIVE